MSSVLLLTVRVPNYHGDADTVITAEWVKQRGHVVTETGASGYVPAKVYSDAELAIKAALRAASRAAARARHE